MTIQRYGFTPDAPLLAKQAAGDYVTWTDHDAALAAQAERVKGLEDQLAAKDVQIALLVKRSESEWAELAEFRKRVRSTAERLIRMTTGIAYDKYHPGSDGENHHALAVEVCKAMRELLRL